jgi:transposase-like protein
MKPGLTEYIKFSDGIQEKFGGLFVASYLRVTDEELEKINIQKANFHGEWNYTILPST